MRPQVHWLETVDSTNLEAQRRLETDCPEGTVLVAAHQTAGRGRLGRDWNSPAGGLYMTVVLRPKLPPDRLAWLSVAGGLAAAEELATALSHRFQPLLKWPNDVLLHGKKVGGILGEARETATGHAVLLGIGLNLTMNPGDLPERPIFPASTVAQETGIDLNARSLAEGLAQRVLDWYQRLLQEGPQPLRQRFTELSAHAGRPLEIQDGAHHWTGREAGLTETGALRLETDQETIEVLSGQILRIGPEPVETR